MYEFPRIYYFCDISEVLSVLRLRQLSNKTQPYLSHKILNLDTVANMKNLDIDEKRALVERGIEEAREALARKELPLNKEATLTKKQWAAVLNKALQ